MTVAIDIELFTDPACPFAFSAEPIRQRLRWHYGDGLRWRTTMIVLTLEPGEAEKLQAGAPGLQRKYGMPIDPAPYPRAVLQRARLPGGRGGAAERARGGAAAAAPAAGPADGRRSAR